MPPLVESPGRGRGGRAHGPSVQQGAGGRGTEGGNTCARGGATEGVVEVEHFCVLHTKEGGEKTTIRLRRQCATRQTIHTDFLFSRIFQAFQLLQSVQLYCNFVIPPSAAMASFMLWE